MRKIIITAIAMAMVLGIATVAQASEQPIRVTVDGQQIEFEDQQPVIVDGRTLVPVRGVFEALGFEVGWENGYTVLERENYVIPIREGWSTTWMHQRVPIWNPESIERVYNLVRREMISFDVPTQIISGRTMIPLRAVAQATGAEIEWDGTTGTVKILTPASEGFQEVRWERLTEVRESLVIDSRTTVQQLLDVGFTRHDVMDIMEREIFNELNRVRTEAGLAPAIWSPELAAATREHCQDMAINGFVGHTGSDGSRSWERAQRHGWPGSASEIAGGARNNAYDVIRMWYNSSGHRLNMMTGAGHLYRTGVNLEVFAGVGFYVCESGRLPTAIKFSVL